MAGDGEPNRVIKDLQKTIAELNRSYREQNLPVTDGSRELHSLCAQLEFLLQFDLKEKRNFFGQRKDYWDFLCQGLARRRQEHEGVRFVTSLDKLKTPVGRARAFLRYCLVHRQLAESLQLCLLDPQSLSEWYYARSPFLSPRRRAEILGSLYELDGITFHLALRRADLDTAWPMFSETPLRPSPVPASSLEKTAPQVGDGGSDAAGRTGSPAVPAPRHVPTAARSPSQQAGDAAGADEGPRAGRDGEFGTSPGWAPGSLPRGPAGSECPGELRRANAALQALAEQLRAEVVALEGQLARAERRHREQEEGSARRAELQAREAEALRETNAFLSGTLLRLDARATELRRQAQRAEEAAAALQRAGEEQERRHTELAGLCRARAAALEAAEGRLRALEAGRPRHLSEAEGREPQEQVAESEAAATPGGGAEAAAGAAAGGGGALEEARRALVLAAEEARGWREAAEARAGRLEEALAERAALASRLEACEAAAAGQREERERLRAALRAAAEERQALEQRAGAAAEDGARRLAAAREEVAALEEALRRALEQAQEPHGEEPAEAGAEPGPSTAADMVMHLAALAAAAQEEAQQGRQQLQAQQQVVARLEEQLGRARQDGERWASALQRAQREAMEREATRGEEQARQQELVRDMKGRLLELLREKDALWQKTEGIDLQMPSTAPRDVGLCARCHKDFRLLSRRYSCRLCHGKVCHTCSVDVGKQGRCCLLCYQQRHQQATPRLQLRIGVVPGPCSCQEEPSSPQARQCLHVNPTPETAQHQGQAGPQVLSTCDAFHPRDGRTHCPLQVALETLHICGFPVPLLSTASYPHAPLALPWWGNHR
ncbi:RUN and FYVE domain-containing protein 4 [Apteryx mantelli]|uniref:RUN and FYVE domain-containing protein 4 n=1 Tax=Apteryx mantelli TaxID=2696672 RepID=A0ABM4EPW4_9AVES